MEFMYFEQAIEALLEREDDQELSALLDKKILELTQQHTCTDLVQSYLFLYASLAGDVESYQRFERIFNLFVLTKQVALKDKQKFLLNSGMGRWF